MHTLETIYFQCLQISLYREGDGYEEDDDDDGFMPRKLFFFSFDHFKVSIYLMISKKKTNKQKKKITILVNFILDPEIISME